MILLRAIYKCCNLTQRIFNSFVYNPIIRSAVGKHGKNLKFGGRCTFAGIENIYFGDSVFIGKNATFLSTRAKIVFGNHIMLGPNVTMISGNHRTDIIGRYMDTITNDEKRAEDDQDIIIKNDVWIGANVTILKGVTIGEGCIIASGSLVNCDTQAYSIWGGGVLARKLKDRFTPEQLELHKKSINQLDTVYSSLEETD